MAFASGSCPGSPAPHLVHSLWPSLLSHAPLPHQLATPRLRDHSASPHVPAWLPEGQRTSAYQRDGRPALTELTHSWRPRPWHGVREGLSAWHSSRFGLLEGPDHLAMRPALSCTLWGDVKQPWSPPLCRTGLEGRSPSLLPPLHLPVLCGALAKSLSSPKTTCPVDSSKDYYSYV